MTNIMNQDIFNYMGHNFWTYAMAVIKCTCGTQAMLVSDIPLYRSIDRNRKPGYFGRGKSRYRYAQGYVEFEVWCMRCGARDTVAVLESDIDPKITGTFDSVYYEAQWIMEEKGCNHETDWLVSPRLKSMDSRSLWRYEDYGATFDGSRHRHLVVCTHNGCRKRCFIWLSDRESFPVLNLI